jgi:hypothetical protein
MSSPIPPVHVRFGVGGPVAAPSDAPHDAVRDLLALDRRTPPNRLPGDRARPLEGGGWAVGRGGFGGVVWRVVPQELGERLAHPAWLWRSSRWFDPSAPPAGALPGPLPLRSHLDPATRLTGKPAATADLLASTIAALRRREGAIAIVVDPAILPDPAPAGRWFLLALLTVLPPAVRAKMRVSSLEASPLPDAWDVVITTEAPTGYTALRPGVPPDLGSDVPARFIADRLAEDDPEQVEVAAQWSEPGDSDPWAAAIHRRWGAPVAPRPTPRAAPERAPAPSPQPRRLRLNTPEAWLSLSDRRDEERAAIVRAWIGRTDLPPPAEDILAAVIQIRPRGRDVGPWLDALFRWVRSGPSRTVSIREIGDVLDTEPIPHDPAVRASLWTEHVAMLLELGHFADALAACDGPTSQALIEAGAGEAVAEAWARLPSSRRPESALRSLAERLASSPMGQPGLVHLWQALIVQEQDHRADVLLQVVAERASDGTCCPIDALLDLLPGSPQAMRWVGHVARRAKAATLSTLLEPVMSGPQDQLWEHFVDVRSQHAPPEDRIADLIGLPLDQVRRLEIDLRAAIGSIRVWRFPDRAVAAGAGRIAALENSANLWSWLQLCASAPGQRPPAGTGSVIDALCARPPTSSDERTALWMMTEGLGSADGWTPPQHAEVLLRLALTPSGLDPNLPLDLGASLVRGVARRADAIAHIAGLTNEMAMLPPGHPATQSFLQRLLPVAFARGVPAGYIRAVRPGEWPTPTRELWQRVVHSLSRVG